MYARSSGCCHTASQKRYFVLFTSAIRSLACEYARRMQLQTMRCVARGTTAGRCQQTHRVEHLDAIRQTNAFSRATGQFSGGAAAAAVLHRVLAIGGHASGSGAAAVAGAGGSDVVRFALSGSQRQKRQHAAAATRRAAKRARC